MARQRNQGTEIQMKDPAKPQEPSPQRRKKRKSSRNVQSPGFPPRERKSDSEIPHNPQDLPGQELDSPN